MSSQGRWYCHRCRKVVGLMDSDLRCSECSSDFIEDISQAHPHIPVPRPAALPRNDDHAHAAPTTSESNNPPGQHPFMHHMPPHARFLFRPSHDHSPNPVNIRLHTFAPNMPHHGVGNINRGLINRVDAFLAAADQEVRRNVAQGASNPVAATLNQHGAADGSSPTPGEAPRPAPPGAPPADPTAGLRTVFDIIFGNARGMRPTQGATAGGTAPDAARTTPLVGAPTHAGADQGPPNMVINILEQIVGAAGASLDQVVAGGGQRPDMRIHIQFGDGGGDIQINPAEYGNVNMEEMLAQVLQQFDGQVGGNRNIVSEEDLAHLPMTTVKPHHVENQTQCSTCFDTFAVDEQVAELACKHIFHRNCVVPWLQQHTTCPMCRQNVNPAEWPRTPPQPAEGSSSQGSHPADLLFDDELD